MTEPSPHEQKVANVQDSIDKIAKTAISDLGRAAVLGPAINFEDIVPRLENIIKLFMDLQGRSISRLSASQLDKIQKAANEADKYFNEIRSFKIESQDPSNTARQIKSRVDAVYSSIFDSLVTPLAFTATQATDYQSLERQAEGLITRIKNSAKVFEDEISENSRLAKEALAAIQDQAAKAGVSQNAQYFAQQATTHSESASKWRTAAIWCTLGTFALAGASVASAYLYTPPSIATAIQLTVAKIVVISVALFALIWCTKNYKSERHNQIVNKHRQNALSTFESFVSSTDNDAIKESILLAASNTAFHAVYTGFEDAPVSDGGYTGMLQSGETISRILARSSSSAGASNG
ncbi:MAG: hypothetical protein ABL309_08330 [Phycisphaerales bacterium]